MNSNAVRTNIIKELINRGALTATVYPDCVEFAGGEDSDDLILKVDGVHKPEEVARWCGVEPSLIEVSELGPPDGLSL